MNNKVNFETSNKAFSDIIGNGKLYSVPQYQRDYSWSEEQWEELWQDILEIHTQNPQDREEHYMGYLVLQKRGLNKFTIIDGQQRLTTLSLLILAALQMLKMSSRTDDEQRIQIIKNAYISSTSPSSLSENFKLKLNRNNDEYYRNDLANLSENPRKRSIKRTEHQMRKAKEFYEKEINKLKLSSEELGKFIEEIISNYLVFTEIVVGDEVNAYKVFETLNARGVRLSTPDLVKNHLFSIIDPNAENSHDIEQHEEQWAITLDNLGTEEFSEFLRCFWNSRNTQATKTNLFKKIKMRYVSRTDASEFIQLLKETSSIYAALQKHNDELWGNITNQNNKMHIQNCLLALNVFNMVQPYSVLLSAYFSYSEDVFAKICKWMHSFCIRYLAICNLPSNDAERFYNRIAIALHEKQTISEIKKRLQSMLPSDEVFKSDFVNKVIPIAKSSKKAYFILASIENFLNPNNPIPLQGSYTIEHILPKTATGSDAYWREQFGDQLEQYVQRMGNITLLTSKHNRDSNRLAFTEKKHIYAKSTLQIVQRLGNYNDWNPESVNDYQAFLANLAVQVWSVG